MNIDLTSKRVVKNLLREKGIRPLKRMGQNFLISKKVLEKIIRTAELTPEDIVIEVGPGIGTLTRELVRRVKKVIAVEKDPEMIKILKETLKDFQNIEIVQGDVLDKFSYIRKKFVFRSHYKIVSNLPYNIATEVVRKFLEIENPPKLMVVMVQKEVGERICSEPPNMERLGVLVQALAEVKIIGIVKKRCFWPSPKVDSVIIKISALNQRRKSAFNQRFAKIVKAGFAHPRKQLVNNLGKGLNQNREKIEKWLKENVIQPTQRAQELSVEDWRKLAKSFL